MKITFHSHRRRTSSKGIHGPETSRHPPWSAAAAASTSHSAGCLVLLAPPGILCVRWEPRDGFPRFHRKPLWKRSVTTHTSYPNG